VVVQLLHKHYQNLYRDCTVRNTPGPARVPNIAAAEAKALIGRRQRLMQWSSPAVSIARNLHTGRTTSAGEGIAEPSRVTIMAMCVALGIKTA
jgi:hypothetical protein